MRIVRQNERELVVDGSTLWVSLACAVAAVPLLYVGGLPGKHADLLVGGLFFVCALGWARTTRFTFDAHKQSVRWRGQRLLRADSGSIPFSEIHDVAMEVQDGSNGSRAYRLALITPRGALPMAYSYSSNSVQTAKVRTEILRFVQPEASAADGGEETPR